ncbi:DUF4062 domain-containing protein [Curtobacterium flaccumfaciens pv. flaccumfaciens]|uniref:DUF4062 domain-containing protein n=1 Tax=Curtobacterium flaccumfaciens TaxID=2035 RepID=UPI001BDF1CF0|nr:DUF4062 domain-containing protein [Curtobacterium flaccumfaciens]MBT1668547.1 DUF4062 domain-containing protein [Curtobacterium flaccumfaciens pv. flaccumfaciens]
MSSTFTDLIEERREVMQALLELNCMPAGMELFPSSDAQQWDIIERILRTCDYYIVIVGGRYGSTTEEGISYTEKEYDLAKSIGIPVLGFIHGNPDDIPAGKTELDQEARERLQAFREKVQGKHIKKWTNADQLGAVVSRSLTQEFQTNPQPGWVRGGHALTPEIETELRNLRAAKREGMLIPVAGDGRTLKQGSDTYSIKMLSRFGSNEPGDIFERDATWDDILIAVGDRLLTEASDSTLRWAICIRFGEIDWDAHEEVTLTQESWQQIVRQFRALGYIELGVRERPINDHDAYWRLTPTGEAHLSSIMALYREE